MFLSAFTGYVLKTQFPPCLAVDLTTGVEEIKPQAAGEKSQIQQSLRILFAAGGTGGHVYPAIAIANQVRRLDSSAHIEFVGTRDRLEWKVVPAAGYVINPIPAVGLRRPILSLPNLLVPLKLLLSLWSSWKVVCRFKPHLVIGTGGYVTGPLCLVAALMGCCLVLQEQNAYPGLTNRLLSVFAKAIFVAFAETCSCFPKRKCIVHGNPTRLLLTEHISKVDALASFFPNLATDCIFLKENVINKTQVVLILGGSLGARSVNMAVSQLAADMLENHPERYIIWQTGPKHYDELLGSVGTHPRLAIVGFIESMEAAYAASDLVVSRSGAITCSEILVARKPSILIPSPNVTEDHQTKNAMSLVEGGAARIIHDNDLTHVKLAALIDETLRNEDLLTLMSRNASRLAKPNASIEIAEAILNIASSDHEFYRKHLQNHRDHSNLVA